MLPEISLEVIGAESPRPKLKMVMRRYLDIPDRSMRNVTSTAHSSSPAVRPTQPFRTGATKPALKVEEFVDARLTRGLIAKAATRLKSETSKSDCDPLDASHAAASKAMQRRLEGRALDVLDPEIYQSIRAECPGWDLDELMKQFDAFVNTIPNELPRNYSKRFFGFMKKHHERNKHNLPGY